MLSRKFLSLVAIATLVSGNNDWSVPCFTGICEYDLPASAGSASGTLKIWGPASSIADITPAAGWEVFECSPESLSQDIKLVCKEGSAADCGKLFTFGAEGKVVRLPESCGAGPFAVISKTWVPEDQTIPADLASTLVRRDGTLPEVTALHIDTNFEGASHRRVNSGTVHFAIRGANIPGASGNIDIPTLARRRFAKRAGSFVDDALAEIQDLNEWTLNETLPLPPININENYNLINEAISCGPIDQIRLKVDVGAKAQALASIGIAVTGTFIPPKVDDIALISKVNANIDGTLNILAGLTGTFDTGLVKLYSVAIPGLDFPGILTIGPSFVVNARATAGIDLNLGIDVGLKYQVKDAQFRFPPSSKFPNTGKYGIVDTPLTLSAAAGVTATGQIDAHLIPSLNVGIDALGGAASAKVYLEVDASAGLNLDFQARAGTEVPIPIGSNAVETNVRRTVPHWARNIDIEARNELLPRALVTDPKADASFSGCVQIGAGVDVNLGASAQFFDIWNDSKVISLYSNRWELFQRCFGSQAKEVAPRSMLELEGRGILDLICPAPGATAPIGIAKGFLGGSDIRELAPKV